MKLKLIALGVLLSISSAGFAMDYKEIKMSKIRRFNKRLKNLNLKVVNPADIVNVLAGQEMSSLKIAVIVGTQCLENFICLKEKTKEEMLPSLMIQYKEDEQKLFYAVFEDYPEELEKLKKEGLFEPV